MSWSEIITFALTGASVIGIPLFGWVLTLQARLVKLETWRDIMMGHWSQFEARIMAALARIEEKVDRKEDRD